MWIMTGDYNGYGQITSGYNLSFLGVKSYPFLGTFVGIRKP